MNALKKVTVVTSNKGKYAEIADILGHYKILAEMKSFRKREIQSHNLEEIAAESARHAGQALKRAIIVEDSGLFIKQLGGFPGPYSSYVFETLGIPGVLRLMKDVGARRAEFKAVVAYYVPSHSVRCFNGRTVGMILLKSRGRFGFGFDPIFSSDGERSFAEMPLDSKNMVSHRGRAVRAFAKWFVEHRR